MKFIIKDANKDIVHHANQFLLELILDEKKYDDNINNNLVLRDFYNEVLNNDNIKLLIVFHNHIAVGYIYGYIEEPNSAYIKRKARIEAIFINPRYRKKLVASKLIDEFEKWSKSKGVNYIEVSVCKSNINAVNLYNKKQYKIHKYTLYKKY